MTIKKMNAGCFAIPRALTRRLWLKIFQTNYSPFYFVPQSDSLAGLAKMDQNLPTSIEQWLEKWGLLWCLAIPYVQLLAAVKKKKILNDDPSCCSLEGCLAIPRAKTLRPLQLLAVVDSFRPGSVVPTCLIYCLAGWHKLQKPGNWVARFFQFMRIFEVFCGIKG